VIATATKRLTWAAMVELEPMLGELLREVKAIRAPEGERFCANEVWYGYNGHPGIKPRLCELVGWDAKHPALRTIQAYDLAYDYLYDRLPDCRDCGEMW
jgi:hypothetical protein